MQESKFEREGVKTFYPIKKPNMIVGRDLMLYKAIKIPAFSIQNWCTYSILCLQSFGMSHTVQKLMTFLFLFITAFSYLNFEAKWASSEFVNNMYLFTKKSVCKQAPN